MGKHSSSTIEEEEDDLDHWFQKLHYSKPKLTRLHFFLHDIDSGPAQTTEVVVPPAKTTTHFGQVNIFDDALTEGPEPTSKLLVPGRCQSTYGHDLCFHQRQPQRTVYNVAILHY
ncbi:hypothetical protein M0R45_007333 [Rubus argutus]|uniref:Dirigent protein n=1 Tax=Rubus argutus TaxID=59490 RepID=A0AAW1XYW0_RUBAR